MASRMCTITIEDIPATKRMEDTVTLKNVHKKCASFFWQAILHFIEVLFDPFKREYNIKGIPDFTVTLEAPKKTHVEEFAKVKHLDEMPEDGISKTFRSRFLVQVYNNTAYPEPFCFSSLVPRHIPNTFQIREYNLKIINSTGYDYFPLLKANIFRRYFGQCSSINEEILNYITQQSQLARARSVTRIKRALAFQSNKENLDEKEELQLRRIRQWFSLAKKANMKPKTKSLVSGVSSDHRHIRRSHMMSLDESKAAGKPQEYSGHSTAIIDQWDARYVDSAIEFFFKFHQSRNPLKSDIVVKLLMVISAIFLSLLTTILLETAWSTETDKQSSKKTRAWESYSYYLVFIVLLVNVVVWAILYHFVYVFKIYINVRYIPSFENRYNRLKKNSEIFYYVFLTILIGSDLFYLIYETSSGSKKYIPLLTIIGIICLSAALSADVRRIPWQTVIPAYFLQFFLLLITLNKPFSDFIDAIYESTDILMMKYFNILPAAQLFEKDYSFMLRGVILCLALSAMIEVLKYFEILPLVFSSFKFLTYLFTVTPIEISYAIGGTFMNYIQQIRLNSNILRILTNSEIHFFLVASFSNSAAFESCIYHSMGVPMIAIVPFKIASIPGIIASAKLLYPEGKVSITDKRDIFPRHTAITHQSRLLTDVWITGLGGGFLILTWQCFFLLLGEAMISLFGFWFVYPWYTDWNYERTDSFEGLSFLIHPLFITLGIDNAESVHFARFFLQRFLITDIFAFADYSKYLHTEWIINCTKQRRKYLKVYQSFWHGRSTMTMASGQSIQTKMNTVLLSPRTLFMAAPLIMNYNSVVHIIAITAYLLSVLPHRRRRRLHRIVLRASLASMLTNFILCIMAGFIFSEKDRIVCLEEKFMTAFGEKTVYCETFLNKLKRISKDNLGSMFDIRTVGGFKINFFCTHSAGETVQ